MAKDPAMLFYTSDFLTGVTLLSMKERGQYITLLCLQQQMGHMSLGQMQTAVGRLSPALLGKYVQDEDGLYYNRRAEEEIRKRQAHCERQRATAMKRWDPEAMPEESHGICHGISHGIATAMPLENESENNTPITFTQGASDALREREEAFESFWKSYPRKVGKQAARKSFLKVPKSVWPKLIPAVEAQKASYQWQRDGGQFIPHPATWLNQGRWDDEVMEGARSREAQELDESYAMMRRWADG